MRNRIGFSSQMGRFWVAGAATAMLLGCGASAPTGTAGGSSSIATLSAYPAAYKAASWGSNTTVSFSGSCSMTYVTNGVPAVHDPYYLAPAAAGQTVVATTPVSHMSMALIAYTSLTLKASTVNLNICPNAAASTTATSLGAIGFLISGVPLFNAYEGTGTVALGDNVSYTFLDGNKVSQTAYFIDSCNSHAAPGMNGSASSWHYHGVPNCVTSLLDASTGPSHLIGFALDGYPIYGGRDMSGNIIPVSQLDVCNGITSVTPEFSAATYHYVLPIGVTGVQSSIGCYHGTVSATVAAAAKRLACNMKGMQLAMNVPMPAHAAAKPATKRKG